MGGPSAEDFAMKRFLCLLLVAVFTVPMAGFAVEPAYAGEFGNPEEPALRPYKWMWRGVKSLFYQTGYGFKHGNMKTPVLGTAETFRGLRKGTFELGESVYHGLAFAPVPPKDSYKKTMRLNEIVDNEKARSNISDLVFSVYAFPVLKFVDRYPAENEQRVQIREERAQATRAAQDAAEAARQPQMEPLERAQREYLGDRYPKNTGKQKEFGRGNLLKLAK